MGVLIPNLLEVIDIVIVIIFVYFVLYFLKKIGTLYVLIVSLLFFILYFISLVFNLSLTFSILSYVIKFWPLAILIILTPEIRSILTNSKIFNTTGYLMERGSKKPSHLVLRAASMLSVARRGGILVIERDQPLEKYFTSGVEIDAIISPKLIFSIFNTNAILHDGAMVIRRERILAAKVVLPLSDNIKFANTLGTRHLAGIGITENSDAMSIIISEETGNISLAIRGNLISNITIEELSQRLSDFTK